MPEDPHILSDLRQGSQQTFQHGRGRSKNASVPGSATWRMSAIILSSFSVTALKDTSLTRSRISRAPQRGEPGTLEGIYRNEDRVTATCIHGSRGVMVGLPGKTPVPISLTVDLDGLEEASADKRRPNSTSGVRSPFRNTCPRPVRTLVAVTNNLGLDSFATPAGRSTHSARMSRVANSLLRGLRS